MKVQRLPTTPKTPFHSPAHRTSAEAATAEKSAPDAPESPLEREFAARWGRLYPELPFVAEFRFHEIRRFRFDAAWPDAKVAAEIAGAVWVKGGHSSGAGITRDFEKMNLAQSGGWIVFQLTDKMARDPETLAGIADLVRGRGRGKNL